MKITYIEDQMPQKLYEVFCAKTAEGLFPMRWEELPPYVQNAWMEVWRVSQEKA